ncbi:hypothetical protein BB561_004530 [Smittium simulii]|uniref:Uncharacterized protein n=1 Tax=Smittium simulii TaxID=133385 RepID=A0A2T9YFV9_9FUNG|nr:hypothetical protein BB561_004530 [Smittium simulii]
MKITFFYIVCSIALVFGAQNSNESSQKKDILLKSDLLGKEYINLYKKSLSKNGIKLKKRHLAPKPQREPYVHYEFYDIVDKEIALYYNMGSCHLNFDKIKENQLFLFENLNKTVTENNDYSSIRYAELKNIIDIFMQNKDIISDCIRDSKKDIYKKPALSERFIKSFDSKMYDLNKKFLDYCTVMGNAAIAERFYNCKNDQDCIIKFNYILELMSVALKNQNKK